LNRSGFDAGQHHIGHILIVVSSDPMSTRKISQIERDIDEFKQANPGWRTSPVDKSLITETVKEKIGCRLKVRSIAHHFTLSFD
jgi:hypothetical protein